MCPKGMYCPLGTSDPIACPAGTFGDKTGATEEADCTACASGRTCEDEGLTEQPADCPAGYHCDTGESDDAVLCSRGHYCPAGVAAELRCPPGEYQSSEGESSCDICPKGKYCGADAEGEGWGGTEQPLTCPMGFYCPVGTPHSSDYPCPIGTLGDEDQLSILSSARGDSSSCPACPAGSFCAVPGLSLTPSGTCMDGYICGDGSDSATGTEPCPVNYWCVGGVPTECPDGTYNQNTGAVSEDECVLCPPGSICPDHEKSMIACPAGLYCPGGAYVVPDSVEEADGVLTVACEAGHYCPEGSAVPL